MCPPASASSLRRDITFDAAAYSVDAIQRAAYRFSDRFSCDLVTGSDAHRCILTVPRQGDEAIEALLADFRTEVLDQVLRERIRAETREVRNVILALAFSNTGLIDTSNQ